MNVEYINSERERIQIAQPVSGDFTEQHVIVIHDDPPPKGSGQAAPMLLDAGTQAWLREQLAVLADPLRLGTDPHCPECGSTDLLWSHIGGGRDSLGDCAEVRIFQGCQECSETLHTHSPAQLVALLNERKF